MSKEHSLDSLMGIICNVFDSYSAVLFLGSSQEAYTLSASFSLGDTIPKEKRIEPGKGLVGWILRNDKPLIINNFNRQTNCLGYYDPEGESQIKAFIGVPLPQGKGALCLDSKKTYSFTEKDQKILFQFAELVDHILTTMEQSDASLQQKTFYHALNGIRLLKEKHPKWDVFLEHMLELVAEATSCEFALFVVRDDRGRKYYLEGWNTKFFIKEDDHHKKFDMGKGLIGWVFKEEKPLYSDSNEQRSGEVSLFGRETPLPPMKTFACVPIGVNRKTRGVLVLADRERLQVTDSFREFLLLITDYLGGFLEGLYLKSKLQNLLKTTQQQDT